MEKFRKYLLFVLFLILSITVSYNYGKIQGLKKYYNEISKLNSTEETFNHTLTSVIFDTVFLEKYIPYYETDTLYLTDTITDSITDTLILKDTVYLPNEISIKDTTFLDTVNNQIINNQLHIQLSGYEVSLDSLCLTTTIKQHATRKKWFERIVPSAGIGIGTNGKLGVFMGIGYRLN